MARVKAEVREQRQGRLAVKTEALSPPPTDLPAPPPQSAVAWIDLTAEDETEDEEEADEPFLPATLPAPVDEAQELPVARETEHSDREEAAADEAARGFSLSPAEDESEVDEEMPQAPGVTSGATPSRLEPGAGEYASSEDEKGRCSGEGGDEMEEEDELWPTLPALADETAKDRGRDSTASEGEGGIEEPEPGKTLVKSGESLEDGEIFEEGAVIKSPRTVKEVISQELQAARAANKKKQKKRGRKKNKRKVELMTAPEEEADEFGRNVRHQHSAPLVVLQPSDMGEYLPSLAGVAGPSLSFPPPRTVMPPPPMLATPPLPPPLPDTDFGVGGPRPFADEEIVRVNRHGGFEPFQFHSHAPPPHLPPNPPLPLNGGFRYVPTSHFSGGRKEPSALHRGVKRPLQSSTESTVEIVAEGSEIFDLDSLRAAALKTKKTAPKTKEAPASEHEISAGTTIAEARPTLSPPPEEDEASLDALRTELLRSMRRKRRDPSNTSLTSTTESENTSNGSAEAIARVSDSNPDISESKGSSPEQSISEAPMPLAAKTPSSLEGTTTTESPLFRPLTAMSQSLVIRLSLDDLAAQSKVRADSYDEASRRLETLARGDRTQGKPSDFLASTAAKLTPPERLSIEPIADVNVPTISCSSLDGDTNTERSGAEKNNWVDVSPQATAGPKAGEAAEQGERNAKTREDVVQVVASAVSPVSACVVDETILSDPVKLEAEHEACQEKIRDADSRIAHLDAEIAALRRAIAAREAESSAGSSITACGA